jgi:hypothetical protein
MDARKPHNEPAKSLYDRQSTCGIESSGGVCVVAHGFEDLQKDPGMNATQNPALICEQDATSQSIGLEIRNGMFGHLKTT